MASVSVEGGGGRKRSLDSEINMVPMIDLLMVTVSFLLITAVWTHMSRLEGTTQVPGDPDPATPRAEVGRLHLDVRGGEQPFHLSFHKGAAVTDGIDVPRDAVRVREGQTEVTRYPGLSATLEELSRSHAADLSSADSRVVVMHTDDELRFGDLVAVMDAVAAVKDPNARPARAGQPPEQAFRVSFAAK